MPRATGKGERPTTLADARKLKLVPSVTTIIAVAAKPFLAQWQEEQVISAACEWHYTPGDDVEVWKKQIRQMSREIGRSASETGNIIHDAMEKWYLGDKSDNPIIKEAADKIELELGEHVWIPEASFNRNGIGGKVDLYSPDGEGIIIDFKTKNVNDPKKLKGYFDHCVQLAAYRDGLNLPHAKCYNLYISTQVPGLVKLHEWKESDIVRGLKMFNALKEYWMLSNKFGE